MTWPGALPSNVPANGRAQAPANGSLGWTNGGSAPATGAVSSALAGNIGRAERGSLPENVNYAVKSSLLLSFLESVPDVAAKLKDANTKDEAFEEVVKSAQDAAVLVLVY